MAQEIRKIAGENRIDVGRINEELQTLWNTQVFSNSSAPIIRPCARNLIIYCPTIEYHNTISPMIDQVASNSPMRIIYLILGEHINKTEASVSGYCRFLPGGGIQICCEQISITARTEDEYPILTATMDSIMPDLPVVLLWLQDDWPQNGLFASLLQLVDRVVIDSEESHDIYRLIDLQKLAESHPTVNICDLAWENLSLWREAIAQAFDEPFVNQMIPNIIGIRICPTPNDRLICSILLAGWIASRLGWRLKESAKEEHSICAQFVTQNDTPARLEIFYANEKRSSLISNSITFISSNNEEVIIETSSELEHFTVQLSDNGNISQSIEITCANPAQYQLISSAISESSIDPIFIDTLNMATHLISS